MKRIDILTLYHPHECINSNEGNFLSIRRVESQKENRLSYMDGAIDLTDYWFTVVRGFSEQDSCYMSQSIGLWSKCEKKDEYNWWEAYNEKWICICLVKVIADEEKKETSIIELNKRISLRQSEGYKLFRTLDNVDVIISFYRDDKEEVQNEIEEIINKFRQGEIEFSLHFIFGKGKLCEGELIVYELESKNCCRHGLYKNGWSNNALNSVKEKVQKNIAAKNKKMISYYQAIVLFLKIIIQYEHEQLYYDQFFIFYPPMSLFLKQLEYSEKLIEKLRNEIKDCQDDEKRKKLCLKKNRKLEKQEAAISDFLNAIENTLYHMGLGDLDILEKLKESRMPYDIPSRLCLIYIAYLNILTKILNDKKYEYKFLLAPSVYSRPVTKCFDFDLQPEDRLVKVQISRNIMQMPRALWVILAHEVSHYVGDDMRNRKVRANCYVNTLCIALTDYLIPESLKQNFYAKNIKMKPVCEKYIKDISDNIYRFLQKSIRKKIEEDEDISKEWKYHMSNFSKVVSKACNRVLEDSSGELAYHIEFINKEIIRVLRETDEYPGLLDKIISMQNTIETNRCKILYGESLSRFMSEFGKILKEVYADLNAVQLLKLSPFELLETYIVSEGCIPEEDMITISLVHRIAMVNMILSVKNKKWKKEWKTLDSYEGIEKNKFLCELKKEVDRYSDVFKGNNQIRGGLDSIDCKKNARRSLFYNREIIEQEQEYFMLCYDALFNKIQEKEIKNDLNIIRNVYRHFNICTTGEELETNIFFADCKKLILNYKENIIEEWKNDKEVIKY